MVFPTPRASNCVEVLAIVKETSGAGYVVMARESGPSAVVSWRMDHAGNCFWGRYGSEAWPAFLERLRRHCTPYEEAR